MRRFAVMLFCAILCISVNLKVSYASETETLGGTTATESYYRTPKLPAVRNQGAYGTCWAFASIACVEIYIMNHPEAAPNLSQAQVDSIDLSELHTVYFGNFSAVDPLGGTEGDSYRYTADSPNFANVGGNFDIAENIFSDWIGPVDESVVPYGSMSSVLASGLSDSLAYDNAVFHLQGFRHIPMTDRDSIKKAVKKYGAVGIGYYDASFYYNSDTYAYYCDTPTMTNHGVTIVGWDDNFDKSNFATEPENNGAWIVRNSRGPVWGDGGYFYLSYEDATISSVGNVFVVESADNYQNNYQYDGAVWKKYLFMPKCANVFTAAEAGGEELWAVSFETSSTNQTYTIKIFKNPTDSVNPETGELMTTLTGSTDYAGMYTVSLSRPVSLSQGDKFAVMVSLAGADGYYGSIVADANATDAGREYSNTGGTGRSLAYYGYWYGGYWYGYWYDYGVQGNTNFHIKAYTNAAAATTYGVTVNGGSGSGYYSAGETVTITAGAAPSGKEFDRWVVVSGGVTITDATAGTTTFTMPATAVTVTAKYRDRVAETTTPDYGTTSVTTEGSTTERVTTEGSTTERGTTEGSTTERVTTEGSTTGRGTTAESTTERETTEGSTTERETTEGSTTERETTEGSTTEHGTTEGSTTEHGTTENYMTEDVATEQGTTEGSTTDPDTAEESTTECVITENDTTEDTVAPDGAEYNGSSPPFNRILIVCLAATAFAVAGVIVAVILVKRGNN